MSTARSPRRVVLALLAASAPIGAAGARPLQQSAAPDGAFESLGGGTAGARGIPRLVFDGAPLVGRPFALRVERTATNAFGFLGVGAFDAPTPLPSFGAVTHPAPLLLLVPFTADADGRSSALVATDPVPGYLLGVSFVAQAFVFDGGATGGLAFTPGRRVAFGTDDPRKHFRDEVFSSPISPDDLDLADFDEDGRLDVVVGFEHAVEFSLHRGLDGARFESLEREGYHSTDLSYREVADVDLDGHMDVVQVANGVLSVHFGAGDGTLVPQFATHPFPYFYNGPIALADLNGDGYRDLLCATGSFDEVLRIALNDGTGTFPTFVDHASGSWPTDLATGDLDADGDDDAVTYDQAFSAYTVHLNDGTGALTAATSIPVTSRAGGIRLRDMNGDGSLDLITGTWTPHALEVRPNDGTGAFGAALSTPLPLAPHHVEIADLDADGSLDVAVGLDAWSGPIPFSDGESRIQFLLGRGDGTFDFADTYRVFGNPVNFQIADLDADGLLDVVYATPQRRHFGTLRGTALGEVESATILDTGPGPIQMVVADIDVDGFDDVLVVRVATTDLELHLGSPQGLEATTIVVPTGSVLAPSIGAAPIDLGPVLSASDATGDGLPDLVLVASGAIEVRAGDGAGGFSAPISVPLPDDAQAVAVRDLNGDGRPELIAHVGSTGELHVAIGTGPGAWTPSTLVSPFLPSVREWLVTDLDGDGALDIAAATSGTSLHVAAGNGDGTFALPEPWGTGTGGLSVAAGDLDGDGSIDLVVSNETSPDVSILIGDGTGAFAGEQRPRIGWHGTEIELTDVDRDGALDLVAASQFMESIEVLLGDGTGAFDGTLIVATAGTMAHVARGDIDGDGLDEWLTLDLGYGQLAVHDDLLLE